MIYATWHFVYPPLPFPLTPVSVNVNKVNIP